MIRLVRAILVLSVISLSSVHVAAQHLPDVHFGSDDEPAKLGVYLPEHILSLVETVSWTTVGGFRTQPMSSHVITTSPLLRVDGLEWDAPLFGLGSLSTVPLDPVLWDSVAFSPQPAVRSGAFRPEPALEIFVARPRRGFSAIAGGWVANSVGDPGPHQYVDSTLANVERVGPGGQVTLSYATDAWFVESHVRARRHGLLSPFVTPRLDRLYDGPHQTPRMRFGSVSLRSGLDVGASRLRIQLTRTEIDDFLFLDAVGHEVPTGVATTRLQLRGTTPIGRASRLSFGATYAATDTEPRPGSLLDWSLHWQESRTRLFTELELGRGRIGTATIGAALARHSGASPSGAFSHSYYLPAMYASGRLRLTDALSQTGGVHVTFGEKVAPAVWTATAIRPASEVRLDLTASAGYRLFSDRPTLWYWHDRGYDLLERAGVHLGRVQPSVRMRFATLSIRGSATLGPRTTVMVGTSGSAGSDLNIIDQQVRVDQETTRPVSSASLDDDAWGIQWSGTMAIESRPHERIAHRLGYAISILHGAPAYRRATATRPQHILSGTALFEPNDRFSIGAVARLESATQWSVYEEAARSSDLVDDHLSPRIGLDLTAYKRFWGPHIDVSVTVRNVLGRRLRYHPLGVDHPTTLAVRMVLRSR